MMQGLLYAKRTLKETIRSRYKISLIFILPVVFVASLSFIYGDQTTAEMANLEDETLRIGVINEDQLPDESLVAFEPIVQELDQKVVTGDPLENGFGQVFMSNMADIVELQNLSQKVEIVEFEEIATMDKSIMAREVDLGAIIPSNFSLSILAGINYRNYLDTGRYILNTTEFRYGYTSIQLSGDPSSPNFSHANAIFSQALDFFTDHYTSPSADITGLEISRYSINVAEFSEFDTYIPGFLVYVLFLGVSGTAGILAYEQERQTMDRIILSGFRAKNLIIGITISQLLVSMVQVVIYFITVYLLGFPGQGSILLVMLISALSVFHVLGIGFFTSAIFKDSKLATGIPSIIGIPVVFLTGSMVPLPKRYIMDTALQVWHINPFFVISELARKILLLESTLADLIPELVIFIISGMILYLSGFALLQKKVFSLD